MPPCHPVTVSPLSFEISILSSTGICEFINMPSDKLLGQSPVLFPRCHAVALSMHASPSLPSFSDPLPFLSVYKTYDALACTGLEVQFPSHLVLTLLPICLWQTRPLACRQVGHR